MMNDKFSAQLRQHLVDTANERPADGQLAEIVERVVVTSQRHPLAARLTWFPSRIGPIPSAALRYGLVAAVLIVAMVAVLIAAGGSNRAPSTVFEGRWTSIDPGDGSIQTLVVAAGERPAVRYEDDLATGGACDEDVVKVFTADGVGAISGDRLDITFPNGGGCGLQVVPVVGAPYHYDPDTDTLLDDLGVTWTRVAGGDLPAPTLPPGPSPTPGPSFEGRWTAVDPSDESTLTLVVGEGFEPTVQFQDDLATGAACVADEVRVFRADGVGYVAGNTLVASYPDGGGCGLTMVPIGGTYHYDPDTDTLLDQDDVTWTRVPEGPAPVPTLRPAPTPSPGCIDLADGGTYTAPASSVAVTATIPGAPAIPWQGANNFFHLADRCADSAAISFFPSMATEVYATSCMPDADEIASFADALARLDTPAGDDISERIDLTIDGHRAARYDISELTTCPGGFGLWHGTSLGEGETGSVYVIDVDGTLLAIELTRDGSQTRAELEETYAIIESLQLGR